jgi:hypothetical protein
MRYPLIQSQKAQGPPDATPHGCQQSGILSQRHHPRPLYTKTDYVEPEERDFYAEFCQTMHSEPRPEGLLETSLTDEITGATWRLRRAADAMWLR